MKWLRSNTNLVLISVLALAIYLGFEPLFQVAPSGISREVLVAAIGAIFVLFTTVVVLRAQTEMQNQLMKDQNELQLKQTLNISQFSQKLKIYEQAFAVTRSCIQNGKITAENLVEMQFVIHELLTFASLAATKSMLKIVQEINNISDKIPEQTDDNESDEKFYPLSDDDQKRLTGMLLSFDVAARSDIYETKPTIDNQQDVELLKNDIQESLGRIATERERLKTKILQDFDEYFDENQRSKPTDDGRLALEHLREIAEAFEPQLSLRITRTFIALYNPASDTKRSVVMRVTRVTSSNMVLLTPNHHDEQTRIRILEKAKEKGYETKDYPNYKNAEINVPLKFRDKDVLDLLRISFEAM